MVKNLILLKESDVNLTLRTFATRRERVRDENALVGQMGRKEGAFRNGAGVFARKNSIQVDPPLASFKTCRTWEVAFIRFVKSWDGKMTAPSRGTLGSASEGKLRFNKYTLGGFYLVVLVIVEM